MKKTKITDTEARNLSTTGIVYTVLSIQPAHKPPKNRADLPFTEPSPIAPALSDVPAIKVHLASPRNGSVTTTETNEFASSRPKRVAPEQKPGLLPVISAPRRQQRDARPIRDSFLARMGIKP